MHLEPSLCSSTDITNLLSPSSKQSLSSESIANIVSILVKCEPNLINSNEDEGDTSSKQMNNTTTTTNKVTNADCQKPPIPIKVYQTTTQTQTQTEKVTTVKSELITTHYHKRSSSRTIQSSESSV
jgi:hypothetical protein